MNTPNPLSILRLLAGTMLLLAAEPALYADPLLSSWFTTYSGKYARIYTTNATETAGTSVTTWTNGTQTQSLPAYTGIQEIDYDSNWVYITSTGLAAYTMGPWENGSFPNLPTNQSITWEIPRTTSVPSSKTLTGNGDIGIFVDGVAMFDSRDAFYWNGTEDTMGTGYWNRDAYVNEGPTFDPAYAHQQNTGTYHYHADPIGLRYLLGDHITYNAATNVYAESTSAVTAHSPILGWADDGNPVYGPYGYSSAMNAASGVRRMVSGYVIRNGSNGTDNLTATGRTSIPQWAVRLNYATLYGSTGATGPNVSTNYPLGRYMEDNDYLGDVGQTLGVNFDLDEHNGRTCVTPEFPGGTYAYFAAINTSGTPVFPYDIGRSFYGNPTGGSTTVPNTATNLSKTGPSTQEVMEAPSVNTTTGNVTLTWTSIEGGTYELQASDDLSTWSTLSSTITATTDAIDTSSIETAAETSNPKRFYRVTRTALATYSGEPGIAANAPGGSGTQGTTVTITITLPTTPPLPPSTLVPTSVTLAGTIAGTSISRPTSGTAVATFAIPANAPTGAQNIVVTFSPQPSYTLTGGFTIVAEPSEATAETRISAIREAAEETLKRKSKLER